MFLTSPRIPLNSYFISFLISFNVFKLNLKLNMKFYNIIKESEFSHLTKEDKIKFLIDKEVFTESKNCFIDDFYKMTIDRDWEIDYSFLNFSIRYLNKEYFLNIDFINEVFDKYQPLFKNIIKRNQLLLEVFESQLDYYPEIEFNNLKSEILKEKRNGLHNKIKYELNKYCNWDDYEFHLSVLKKFLITDLKGMYEYLNGNFTDRYYLDMIYSSYLYNKSKLHYINEFDNSGLNKGKGSLPEKIALLETVNFFNLEKIKSITDADKYKILAFLFDIEKNNKNRIDDIRRNYKSLSVKSGDNAQKYTAHKHVPHIYYEIIKKN